jgi:hypothetical protein
MANFNTHLNVTIVTSGLAAATLLSAHHIDFNCALWLWLLGTIGGLLPDIDSDNSTSLNTIFAILTLTAVLVTLRYLTEGFFKEIRFMQLITVSVAVYTVMRFILRPLFEKATIHRGSCHSIAFIVLCALLTIQLTLKLGGHYVKQPDIVAWYSAGFVFFGGLIHLLLDEIYSVDLLNVKIKRSFGTAIKPVDLNHKTLTLLILLAIFGLAYIAPSPENTLNSLTNWSKFKL